jgi:hypothetical protein
LILHCLEKKPARRPQDAEALLGLLRDCRVAASWSRDRAKDWWLTHLAEMCQ